MIPYFPDGSVLSAWRLRLSTGASKPATYGRFKTSQGSGVLIPFLIALELHPGTSVDRVSPRIERG
jgi:hypothetical protein